MSTKNICMGFLDPAMGTQLVLREGIANSHPLGMEGKSGCTAHASFALTNRTSWRHRVTREFVFLKVTQGSLMSFLPVGLETTC